MPLATSTFLQVIFAVLIVMPIVILWVFALVDIFRSHYGGAKLAAWIILVLVFPIIGAITYFIVHRPTSGTAEEIAAAEASQRAERARQPIGGTGSFR